MVLESYPARRGWGFDYDDDDNVNDGGDDDLSDVEGIFLFDNLVHLDLNQCRHIHHRHRHQIYFVQSRKEGTFKNEERQIHGEICE